MTRLRAWNRKRMMDRLRREYPFMNWPGDDALEKIIWGKPLDWRLRTLGWVEPILIALAFAFAVWTVLEILEVLGIGA